MRLHLIAALISLALLVTSVVAQHRKFHDRVITSPIGKAIVLHDVRRSEISVRIDFEELDAKRNSTGFRDSLLGKLCPPSSPTNGTLARSKMLPDSLNCEETKCNDAIKEFTQMKEHLSYAELGAAVLFHEATRGAMDSDIEDILYHARVPMSMLEDEEFVEMLMEEFSISPDLFRGGLTMHDLATTIRFSLHRCDGLNNAVFDVDSPNFLGATGGVIKKLTHVGKFSPDQELLMTIRLPMYAVLSPSGQAQFFEEDDCKVEQGGIFICEKNDFSLLRECNVYTLERCFSTHMIDSSSPSFFRSVTMGWDTLVQTRIRNYVVIHANRSSVTRTMPTNGLLLLRIQTGATVHFGTHQIHGWAMDTWIRKTMDHDLPHVSSAEWKYLIKRTGKVIHYKRWLSGQGEMQVEDRGFIAEWFSDYTHHYIGRFFVYYVLAVASSWVVAGLCHIFRYIRTCLRR